MTAVPPRPAARDRYAQCTDDCTTDCGACKGAGRPAPDAAAGDGMRSAIAEWLFRQVMDREGKRKLQWEHLEPWTQEGWVNWAENLLALPALRDVLAAAARDAEKLARVRAAHVPTHSYCLVDDRDRDVELVGNNPDCEHWTSYCRACDYAWPCLTIRALDPS